VSGFLMALREGDREHQPLSATSAGRTVVAVRGFHKFAVRDGLATTDPLVSPLWAASHADLPPALVQTADLDPLRDEGRLYAERLEAGGVPVRHTNYAGAPHGFASFPGATTIGKQHRAELATELRRHLHP